MNYQKSFTLIEILISVFIFALVTAIANGIFVSGLRTQQEVLKREEVLNQISYALEYMSRALRMARKDLTGTCISVKGNYEITHEGKGIKFKNYKGECQEFYLENDALKENKNGILSNLTSDDLEIISLRINEHGWEQPPDDMFQPRITLFLEIKLPGLASGESILQIQTTISQRNLDVQR